MSQENDSVVSETDEKLVETDQETVKQTKKARQSRILLMLLAVVLVVSGATLTAVSLWSNSGTVVLFDMEGNRVVLDDPSSTLPEFVEAADMVISSDGQGFVIPAVALHVPLGAVNDVNGEMNPPDFTAAFWIRNRGVSVDDAELGTVYVVAHSARNGVAPGNFVQVDEHSRLQQGDSITVDGHTYEYVSYEVVAQTDLASHTELWVDQPGRLVFVTCLQKSDRSAPTDNLVIIGQLAPE
jgi:hypothetical protein